MSRCGRRIFKREWSQAGFISWFSARGIDISRRWFADRFVELGKRLLSDRPQKDIDWWLSFRGPLALISQERSGLALSAAGRPDTPGGRAYKEADPCYRGYARCI